MYTFFQPMPAINAIIFNIAIIVVIGIDASTLFQATFFVSYYCFIFVFVLLWDLSFSHFA